MRKTLLAIALAITTISAKAQADYKPILQATFNDFDTTYADMSAKAAIGNKLVLIAKKYPEAWAPQFYAAYSRVQLSYFEQDAAKRDAILDEAENYRAEAVRILGKDNTETEVLAATIANSRIGVNPQNRWQKYGKVFDEHLDKAKELNADNPRIYLQKGISKFYTPKMFGGGKKAAKPYFDKAADLFAKESKEDIDKPYWGAVTLAYFQKLSSGEDKD
jgi:hypothetical protein